MSLVSNWMHVDLFTVDQAAALWAGFDPAGLYTTDSMKPSEVYAAKQMILGAVLAGEIPANSTTNRMMASMGDYSRSLVSRNDLEEFARKKRLYPAFLFDTIAPFEKSQQFGFDHPRATLVRGRSEAGQVLGRPQEYDWDAFVFEIIRLANQPDGLPERQADLIRKMLAWFQGTAGREPAESSVKERISKIYKYLARAKKSID